jgi:anti-anti-sigma factor
MHITCRRHAPRASVALTGSLSIGPGETGLDELQALVGSLVETGCVDVTFDLCGLDRLDARGLGEIAQTYKRLRLAGGALTLTGPNGFVRRMLAVTRLDTIIPVRDAEPAPAAGWRPGAGRAPSPARAERAPG